MFWKLEDAPKEFQIQANTGGRSTESLSRMADAEEMGPRFFHQALRQLTLGRCGQISIAVQPKHRSLRCRGARVQRGLRHRRRAEHQQIGEARSGLQFSAISRSFEVRPVAFSVWSVC